MNNEISNQNKLLIGAAIILVVIIALILILPKNQTNQEEKNVSHSDDLEPANTHEEEAEEPTMEYNVDEELCEDYVFKQGEQKIISGHKIEVKKIASSSIRLTVDGKDRILGIGAYEKINGIGLELVKDNLQYFSLDDEYNSVELKVGCDSNEEPIDKYVNAKGKAICKTIIAECENKFDY